MAVEMPKEPTYYYECSYGDFRLVYHIPFSTVEKLVAKGAIQEKVLQDFPDGIDINCFSAEYDAFKTTYNYKPSADPEKMRRAFLALFYSGF